METRTFEKIIGLINNSELTDEQLEDIEQLVQLRLSKGNSY